MLDLNRQSSVVFLMKLLILTFNFRFNTFNSSQSKFLVRQAKSEEYGWLRTGPTDTWLKYCGTAGKPGGQQRKQTSTYRIGRNRSTRLNNYQL
jgi:hypothetical protein